MCARVCSHKHTLKVFFFFLKDPAYLSSYLFSLGVLVSFFPTVTKRQEDFKGGKVYLVLIVSEISVHKWPTPLLWAGGEAEHQGGKMW